jgi:hypothetical protein
VLVICCHASAAAVHVSVDLQSSSSHGHTNSMQLVQQQIQHTVCNWQPEDDFLPHLFTNKVTSCWQQCSQQESHDASCKLEIVTRATH